MPGNRHLTKVRQPRVRARCGLKQFQQARLGDRTGPIADLELAENLIQVPLRRTDRCAQLVGDFLIGRSVVEEAQDFPFRLAERFGERRGDDSDSQGRASTSALTKSGATWRACVSIVLKPTPSSRNIRR